MVEVNGAKTHGRYEQIWLYNLGVISNVKGFANQDSWLAGKTNTTHYIDPYDTHIDKDKKKKDVNKP